MTMTVQEHGKTLQVHALTEASMFEDEHGQIWLASRWTANVVSEDGRSVFYEPYPTQIS